VSVRNEAEQVAMQERRDLLQQQNKQKRKIARIASQVSLIAKIGHVILCFEIFLTPVYTCISMANLLSSIIHL